MLNGRKMEDALRGGQPSGVGELNPDGVWGGVHAATPQAAWLFPASRVSTPYALRREKYN